MQEKLPDGQIQMVPKQVQEGVAGGVWMRVCVDNAVQTMKKRALVVYGCLLFRSRTGEWRQDGAKKNE